MKRGRKPIVHKDNDIQKYSKEYVENIEKRTPQYLSQEFTPPTTLNNAELEVWNWLVQIFRETVNSMVSDADVHLMEMYCRAKVAADEAEKELKLDPRAYVKYEVGVDAKGDKKYQLKANPNIKKRKENMQLALKFFDQLGLTPLARARVGVNAANAKKVENEFAKLLNRSDDE